MTVSTDDRFTVVDLDDPEEVRAAAGRLVSVTGAAETSVERMQGTRSALESQYTAPETEALLGALARPRRDVQEYSAVGETVWSALQQYADRLQELVRRRSRLVADITTFLEQGAEGAEAEDWEAREERIAQLQRGCHGLAADKDQAQQTCAVTLLEITTSAALPRGSEEPVPRAREAEDVPVPDQTFGEWAGDVFSLTPFGGFGGESVVDDAVWAGDHGMNLSGAAAEYGAVRRSESAAKRRAGAEGQNVSRRAQASSVVRGEPRSPKPGRAASYSRWATAGKTIGVLGSGFSGVTGGLDQWGDDGRLHPGMETPERLARAVTVGGLTLGGSLLGSRFGSMVGGGLGSLINPAGGTMVGIVVGGLFGGIAGGYAGREIGEWWKQPAGRGFQLAYDAGAKVADSRKDQFMHEIQDGVEAAEDFFATSADRGEVQ